MGNFSSWPPRVEYDGTNREERTAYVVGMAERGILAEDRPHDTHKRDKSRKPKKTSKTRVRGSKR
jgi:hypothetical protein